MSSVRFTNHSQFRFRRPTTINENRIIDKNKEDKELDFGKVAAFMTPTLLFFGVLRLVLYYLQFNVSILQFIDLSEILTSFFDIIILVVIATAGATLCLYLNFDYAERKQKNPNRKVYKKKATELRSNFFNPQNWTLRGAIYVFIVLTVLWLLISIMFLFLGDDGYMRYITAYLLAIVIPLYFSMADSNKNLNQTARQVILCAYYLLATSTFIYFITCLDAKRVKQHIKFHGVKIFYKNNQAFTSDGTCTYIGHTRNYLFLYNTQTNTTSVEKMEEVKTIEFPQIKAPKIQ